MGETENGERPGAVISQQQKRRLSRLSRWVLWIGAVVLVTALVVGGAIAILLHRAEPMLRSSLIDTLQKRFHSKVELDDLRVSILDGFWVEGRGLRIWLPPDAAAQGGEQAGPDEVLAPWRSEPWIVVEKLRFHASWRIFPGRPIEVSVIHVEGVRVLLPPREDRPHLALNGSGGETSNAKTNPVGAQSGAGQPIQPQQNTQAILFKMPQIQVRRVECQGAQLVIEHNPEPGKPAKPPMDFEFAQVTLIPDGKGGPIAFSVNMTNPKPVGTIHSTGKVGPWVAGDPGVLPIEGDYHFDHADLSTIKGIAGILSSTGHYSGTLHRIEADGETETPDFRLERVSKSPGEMLTTHFHAIVDGTDGDTWLQPVEAVLGHTHIVAKGQVVRVTESNGQKHGHDILLEVTVDRGRIEDILHISANQETPFLTGNLTLQTHFHLPPGQASIWDKLQLGGQFHLSQARFTNEKMQGRIEQLSLRGQGKPNEVKSTNPTSILSDMQGHFNLGGGMLQLPDLDYHVPGAEIAAHGTYGLKAGTLDFAGDAKLDASLSKIVGGWKGILLKPADRFLRKNGAGTDLPIQVSGTRKEPKFGVEFDRLGKNDNQ